ncbi:hypothetical protein scyTo_0024014, partial [Scyliorhinus torazame]|nr:hypothetical protein [Scyliorhinus torazame]
LSGLWQVKKESNLRQPVLRARARASHLQKSLKQGLRPLLLLRGLHLPVATNLPALSPPPKDLNPPQAKMVQELRSIEQR